MLVLISIALFVLSSVFLVWYLLAHDHGPKEPKSGLLAAVGFGVLAVMAAAWAEYVFMRMDPSETTVPIVLFGLAMLVGIIEELSKFGPLALFIRNKPYFNEHTDGIIYFGIVGLTFGLLENIVYAVVYSKSLEGGQLTGITRLFVLLFFHAATTGIVGYYYAKAKIQKQSIIKPLIALFIFATIHGVYDFMFFFSASSYSASSGEIDDNKAVLIILAIVSGFIISALLNTFLFLYYRRAQQWDASIGLAIDPKLTPQTTYSQPLTAQTTVNSALPAQPMAPAPTPLQAPVTPAATTATPTPVAAPTPTQSVPFVVQPPQPRA